MWVSHPFYILLTIHEPSRGTEILLNKDSSFIFLLCSWFLTKPLFFWSFYEPSNAQGIFPLVQASAGAILASNAWCIFPSPRIALALHSQKELGCYPNDCQSIVIGTLYPSNVPWSNPIK